MWQMEMVKTMSDSLTKGKVAKNLVLVLVLFILILVILPQHAAAEEKVINASEIIGNISRGEPVEVTNCVIIGDLDVSEIRDNLTEIEIDGIERKIVESQIRIRDSAIQGNVNFNPIHFNDTVVFKNVTFEGVAFFWYATFNKTPDFQDSTFKDKADFGEATFNEGAPFSRVKFNYASFLNATFNNNAFFDSTTFDDRAIFRNAIFVKKANFYNCIFNDAAIFFNATFNNSADFQWATFNGAVTFEDATFNGYANFIHVTFKKAYFEGATFTKIDFRYVDFDIIEINWSQLKGKLIYSGRLYQALIKNFKALEQFEDANDAYYEYRKIKQSQKEWGDYTKYTDAFYKYVCGYGIKPLRPILSGIVIILVFSFGYYQTGAIKQTCSKVFPKTKNIFWKLVDENMKHFLKNHKRYKNALYFSASTFIPLTYGNWYPTAKFLEIRKVEICRFRTIAIAEAFLGWIIMTLFVISLTITWIR